MIDTETLELPFLQHLISASPDPWRVVRVPTEGLNLGKSGRIPHAIQILGDREAARPLARQATWAFEEDAREGGIAEVDVDRLDSAWQVLRWAKTYDLMAHEERALAWLDFPSHLFEPDDDDRHLLWKAFGRMHPLTSLIITGWPVPIAAVPIRVEMMA